jgi:hypothetical protein
MPGFGGWFGQKALAGGGPLIDLGVHRLDLALWLMGCPQPAWIMGATYGLQALGAAEAGVGQPLPVEPAEELRVNGSTLGLTIGAGIPPDEVTLLPLQAEPAQIVDQPIEVVRA